MTRRTAAALLAWAVVVGALAAQSPPAAPSGAVIVVEYDGIIHPIAAEFLDEVLTRADTSGARLVVVMLRTPGGLLDSTRTMVARMIAARTPVAVFVAPSGSRAASAGFILTLAADVAAMAPGTHIGAAHPVSATGQQPPDEIMAEKAASDTAAYARTLAEARGRNVALAEAAVRDSRAFTDQEALTASPPLIDLVAVDVNDLLAKLDGQRITRFNGQEVTLSTSGAAIERMEMSRRQQLLSAIAHPQIAYLLLSLGMLGLVVELWNPGAIVPGVVGGISLLLAFFAFQVLPVNATGILLIVLGIGLLLLEIKVPSFGVLGIGGIVSLVAGAVLLTTEIPGLRINFAAILPVAIGTGGLVLLLGRLAMRAQQQRPVTGAEGLVGERGRALTAIDAHGTGQVAVHGEIWRATSDQSIAVDTKIRVVALDGLTLTVRPVDEFPERSAT